MSQATLLEQSIESRAAEFPYPKSWMDGLIQWIQQLPGPTWAFYIAAVLLIAVLNNAVFWLDGSHEMGTLDPVRTIDTGFIVFLVALYHHLSLAARGSLQIFRPVLKASEPELNHLEYRLTTLPRRLGWLAVLIGIVAGIASVQSDPAVYGLNVTNTILPTIYQTVGQSFVIASGSGLIFQTIRQLRFVNELHRKVSEIDLFRLEPLHAFSKLTARAGIGLVLLIVFNLLVEVLTTAAPISVMIGIGVLAFAVFTIPLLGMRNRMKQERAQLLNETNAAIKSTIGRIHGQVNSNEHDEIAGLNTTLNALVVERDLIGGISTWPWEPSTFRGFASSLLLPLLLWLVTRLLERLV